MIPNTSPFQPGDKVVCYCRYSEGEVQGNKNTSTEEQEAAIREFCNANSLQLVQVFADPFASGRSVAKRDKYLEMLSYLLHGKKKQDIQGVILWDYERYGRNYDRAQYDAAQLRMKGYKLFSMQQPIADDSPFAHVLESMYFASAQNQSDMISADVKRALQSNFTKWHTIPKSNIPLGWLPVPVKMGYYKDGRERIGYRAEPDPLYKDKIAKAIEARLDMATVSQMVKILGGKFSRFQVISLMQKPLLYGSMTYGGTTIEDYCDPIITKEMFDRLQLYNDSVPKRHRSPGAGVYSLNRSLLSGLMVCGECGGKMHLDRRKAKGHTYETYYCNGYHIGIRREQIEDMIIDCAMDLLTDKWQDTLETLIDALQSDFRDHIDKHAIEQNIREIDRKLKRLMDVILYSSNPPESVVSTMNDLEAERKKLMAELNASGDDGIEKIRELAEKGRSRILSVLKSEWTSTDEKRMALATFIQEIVVYSDKRHRLQVNVVHGLPDLLGVADDFGSGVQRPSSDRPYTRNLLTLEFFI